MTKKLYGLIGHPLGHSFSQRYFRDKFAVEGIEADYLNFDIGNIGQLPEIIADHPDLSGLNVTIPYKQSVMPLLDTVCAEARAIGAVNVIKIERRGETTLMHGYNSDCIGFGRAIDNFAFKADTDRALILGTGGASLAVKEALRVRGIAFDTVSRRERDNNLTYEQLRHNPILLAQYRLIVNATPLGTYPNEEDCPDLPYPVLTPNQIAVDLVYNPAMTTFMRRCAEQGCAVKNGLQMLHEQAEAAWKIWTKY